MLNAAVLTNRPPRFAATLSKLSAVHPRAPAELAGACVESVEAANTGGSDEHHVRKNYVETNAATMSATGAAHISSQVRRSATSRRTQEEPASNL